MGRKPKEIIEIGRRFEGTILTYIGEAGVNVTPSGQRQRKVLVQCDCGNTSEVRLGALKNKGTKSCGCLMRESSRKNGKNNKSHGLTGTKVYHAYRAMVSRCYDEKDKDYYKYGDKGIRVCERWMGDDGVTNFVNDMGERPDGLTLDRIDSSGNYSPENCKWSDYTHQSYNRGVMPSNKTGRTGVKFAKWSKPENPTYQAYIKHKGKQYHLITTKDFELAVFCRSEAEIHFYGYNKE